MINKQSYQIQGMKQDNLVATGFSSKFAHEIMNMRLNTIGDYTTASWTTEKGTKEVIVSKMPIMSGGTYTWITDKIKTDNTPYTIEDFKPIGQAIINDYWVLFGQGIDSDDTTHDVILCLKYNIIGNEESLMGRILYWGNLGFSLTHPIETLPFYENELIQKIYWTDGLNQIRVINIKGAENSQDGFNSNYNTQFDFAQEVSLNEVVTIQKESSSEGMFPPCTVKYAITYYRKYGQETNIVYESPLYYPTLGERACGPDELSGDIFKIRIDSLDKNHNFDYIRLYSIIRTSEGATPIVKIIEDKPIDSNTESVEFIDSNTKGIIIDPSILYYIGGVELIAGTLNQKDNVLFLGDITLKRKSVTSLQNINLNKDDLKFVYYKFDRKINEGDDISPTTTILYSPAKIIPIKDSDSFYNYSSELNRQKTHYMLWRNRDLIPMPYGNVIQGIFEGNSFNIKNFKKGEYYRVGIQFQDIKGRWSEVIKIKDIECDKAPDRVVIDTINTGEGIQYKYGNEYQLPVLEFIIKQEDCLILLNEGYKKARLVCCYTTNADRSFITQGVISPTVSNIKNKEDNCPTAQSSWFFRPFGSNDIGLPTPNSNNIYISDKEVQSMWPTSIYNSSIESIRSVINTQLTYYGNNYYINYSYGGTQYRETIIEYWKTGSELYYWGIDTTDDSISNWSIKLPETYSDYITYFNSGDNQFSSKGQLTPTDYAMCHDILYTLLNTIKSNVNNNSATNSWYSVNNDYWTLNTPDIEFDESILTLNIEDFKIRNVGSFNSKSRAQSVYIDATAPFKNYQNVQGSGLNNKEKIFNNSLSHDFDYCYWQDLDSYYHFYGEWLKDFCIYPFQRANSLNTYISDVDKWSYQYAPDNTNDASEGDYKVTQSAKISTKVFSTLLYSSMVDYIKPLNYVFSNNSELKLFNNSPVIFNGLDNQNIYYGNVNTISQVGSLIEFNLNNVVDPSDSKIWVGAYPLMYFDRTQPSSPRSNKYRLDDNTSNYMYSCDPVNITYKSTPHIVIKSKMSGNGDENNTYYVAEIYRNVNDEIRFGGSDNKNNVYTPCGPAVTLSSDEDIFVYGYEGDHYLMRYDCLKTYPYTTEDTNQVVEILSFICETRVNLDGRYDKNRGLTDNTIVLPTNFNLINKSYTQSNNLFSYTELKDDIIATEIDKFPNQITWTKPKVYGEDVDTWTDITLASTADADGTAGSITKLINFNDRLLLFQEHGLSQITYNENTAISTEANIPLELAKTGKFTGFNYLSKEIGCQNKWSISQSKNGLFWIDDSRQELLCYTDGIKSLSTLNGFDTFMIKELPTVFTKWNPNDFNNFITYYDKLSNDVYYINKNYCLAWNEQTNSFTSFYNYEHVPYMANIGKHSLMFNNGIWAAREADTYSTFFGSTKDYWMTLVCDGQTDKGSAFPADKVFNNIEYRADIYNLDGTNTNYSKTTFNKQHVWNGYQDSEECSLNGIRKFNTWRVQLPRHKGTRDRIRNPFCYIKLKQDQSIVQQTDRVILHDLAVYFDMR